MTISIRNAKHAKTGLQDMIDYMGQFIDVSKSSIIEIGSYVGDSSDIFARNFKTVYCIDPWENGYDDNDPASHQHKMSIVEAQFDELIMEVYSNVVKIKNRSEIVARNFHDNYFMANVVYIDGEHTYNAVKQDIESWLPHIQKGGIISGHDYQPRFQGTIDAVNEFKKPDKVFKDTSWVIRI